MYCKFRLDFLTLPGPAQHIPARAAVQAIIQQAASPYTFSHCKVYAAWETDQIIGYELWRNLGLAILCVFLVTLVLLGNLTVCCIVLATVILTLTDIIGFLHFWDITIDVISWLVIHS